VRWIADYDLSRADNTAAYLERKPRNLPSQPRNVGRSSQRARCLQSAYHEYFPSLSPRVATIYSIWSAGSEIKSGL